MVSNMFKQNIKKKEQKQINEVQKKKKTKKYGVCFHAEKNGMCTGKKNGKNKYA